jgi:hypothetical protein
MANIQKRIFSKGVISSRVQIRRKGYPAQAKTFETRQRVKNAVLVATKLPGAI